MNSNLRAFAHGSAAAPSRVPPDDVVPTDDETVRVALKAYVRLAALWALTDREAAALLELTTRTWQRIKREQWNGERLAKDQLLRIGTLVGSIRRCRVASVRISLSLSRSSSTPPPRSPVAVRCST